MNKVTGRLQVFYENQFWIGIFEVTQEGKLKVCKVTFGAEPRDYEVLEFIQQNYYNLKFSPSVDSTVVQRERINPKRLQREVKKQIQKVGIGTKSQQALKLQQENGKIERKKKSHQQREAEKEFQFERKQQKRKEKHKGR